jgi:hypothetical protein
MRPMTDRLRTLAAAAALVALAGCARRHAAPPEHAAPPAPGHAVPAPAPAATPSAGAGDEGAPATLGNPCPPAGCAAGQMCVEWCGFAGCRPGSVFRTCEIPCKTDAQCPADHVCGTVADGPGRVCVAAPRPEPAPAR